MSRKLLTPLDLNNNTLLNVNNAAKAFASAAGDKVNAQLFGIDPTGTTAIDTILNGLITGLPSTGGEIFLGEGTFKVSTQLLAALASGKTIKITGAATLSTTLVYFGSTDCIRMFNSTGTGPGGDWSGVSDLTIDGTNATSTADGLHMGDVFAPQVQRIMIQNFTGAGQIGLHLDNTKYWTEEGDYRLVISNCTQGVALDVTTGFDSYGYSHFDITFLQAGAQSCSCVLNGANLYHSYLKIRGDVNGSSSALTGNPAVIFISGTGPLASQASGEFPSIASCHLDVMIEANDLSGSATHIMQTLYLDSATFGNIATCYGILAFNDGPSSFAPSSSGILPANNGQINFTGIIRGDTNLNPTDSPGWLVLGAPFIALGGTDTSGTAVESTPTFVTNTAKQLSTAQDVMLYVSVNTAITFSLAFGSTSSTATTLVPSATHAVSTTYGGYRIPRGWWVKIVCATMADLTFAQVTC